jgi:hypothetical protein
MIPDQLSEGRRLIKIHPPEADCNHPGKEPIGSATDGPFYTASEIENWVKNGGNVGRALIDDTIVFDVDSEELAATLREMLPSTFVVQTGTGGEHWYYRSSWDTNRQLNKDSKDLGSIRASGWQVITPPSRHPNGDRYQVLNDEEITSIGDQAIEAVLESLDQQPTQPAARQQTADSGGAARVGGSLSDLPDEYPDRKTSIETARQWIVGNNLEHRFDRAGSDIDESGDDYVLCKCLAEAGIAVEVIIETLNQYRISSAKWNRRGDSYRKRTAVKAVKDACKDDFVDFSTTADMGASEASERRKTEVEDPESSTDTEVNINMSAEYTDHEEVTVLEGTDDGDSFKKVVRTTREEDGESIDYVSIKSGRVELVETVDGEEVLAQRVHDSTSLGSPDHIGDLAEALSELDEKINGQ